VGSVGKIGNDDDSVERWEDYTDRLEQYFLAYMNDVREEKHVVWLLSSIRPKPYGLLKNLTAWGKTSTKTYDVLVQLLKEYINSTPYAIAETFRFHKREQKPSSALRRSATTCEFGTFLNDTLRGILDTSQIFL